MRCLFLFLLAVVVGCCSGCEEMIRQENNRAKEARKSNKTNLAEGGLIVGVLPDGRELKVLEINAGIHGTHYVYIVDGATSTTTNRTERQGKRHVLRTEAVIGE